MRQPQRMLICLTIVFLCLGTPFVQGAPQAQFLGTSGNDEVLVNMDFRIIRINGVVSAIPENEDVVFNGNGGMDSVRYFADSGVFERAYLRPDSLEVTSDEFSVLALDCEQIQANGNNDDIAFLFDDAASDDMLVVRPAVTILFSSGFDNEARGFLRANVISSFGGNDTAFVSSNAFRRLVANEDSFSLVRRTTAMNHFVTGFENVETQDLNEFVFFDTPGNDFVRIRRNLIRWEVPEYNLLHLGTSEEVAVLGEARAANELDADEADIKLNRVSDTNLVYDFDNRNDQSLSFYDEQISVLVTQFEALRCESSEGFSTAPANADLITNSQRTFLTADACEKTTEFDPSGGLGEVHFSGFDNVTFNKQTPGNNSTLLFVNLEDTAGDDQLELQNTPDNNCENTILFRRINASFISDTFDLAVYEADRVTVRAENGGFDSVQSFLKENMFAEPGKFTASRSESCWVGFEDASINGLVPGQVLRVNAMLTGDNSNSISEVLVSPCQLSMADEMGRVANFSGYPRIELSGSDSFLAPSVKKDYGFGPGKLRVTYNNLNDASLSLIKNKRNSLFNRIGWEYKTDSASLFISRFDNVNAGRFEILGLNNVQVLNAPADFPITVLPLPNGF